MKITKEQAFELARPLGGGGFQYGDAQGDVTHKFALAVIEWYEAETKSNRHSAQSDFDPCQFEN